MALTDAQRITVFQIIGIPYAGKTFDLTDESGLNAIERNPQNAEYKAATMLNNHITNVIDADSALSAKVIALVDKWDALETFSMSLNAGTIGDMGGIDNDPDRERATIQELLKPLVPFRSLQEAMEYRGGGGGSGMSVPLIR